MAPGRAPGGPRAQKTGLPEARTSYGSLEVGIHPGQATFAAHNGWDSLSQLGPRVGASPSRDRHAPHRRDFMNGIDEGPGVTEPEQTSTRFKAAP